MRCLYCGREIGAFRGLRDKEFCGAEHRKNYGERLHKAIHQMAEPEPAPSKVAVFATRWPAQEGRVRRSLHRWESGKSYPVYLPILVLATVEAAEPVEETVPSLSSVRWMPSPQAEPVARLVTASMASEAILASSVRLPAFSIAAPSATHKSTPYEAWMPSPPAEPVARLVASATAQNLPYAVKPPAFSIASSTLTRVPPPSSHWMRSPEAEPVERLVLPHAETAFTPSQATVHLLALELSPEHDQLVAEEPMAAPAPCETWMPSLAAEPVAQMVWPAAGEPSFTSISLLLGSSTGPLALPTLPKLQGPAAIAAAMPLPAAEPVSSFVGQTAVHTPIASADAAPKLPELALTPVFAADAETETELPVGEPPLLCEVWMHESEPELVFSYIRWSVADEAFAGIGHLSAGLALTIDEPHIPAAASMRPLPVPEPVMAGVWPRVVDRALNLLSSAVGLRLPNLAAVLPFAEPCCDRPKPEVAASAAAAQPAPLESWLRVAAYTMPVIAARAESRPPEPAAPSLATSIPLPALAGPAAGAPPVGAESFLVPAASTAPLPLVLGAQMTRFALSADAEQAMPVFDKPRLTPAPSAPQRANHVVVLRPISTIAVTPPEHQYSDSAPTVPPAGFVPVEYHLQRMPGEPIWRLMRERPNLKPVPPQFAIRPVFDRLAEEAAIQKPARKEPAFAEVFTMPEAKKRPDRRVGFAGKAIAASLVVGGIWLGTSMVRLSRQTMASRQDTFSGSGVSIPTPSLSANAGPVGASAGSTKSSGPVAWVRNTVADRASFQAGDNFHDGMQAWGAAPGTYAPRWERSRDGYVRPGDLALFRPSLKLTNYRFEFFGQLDAKGLGWVVRAKDPQNYYAMKVKVLEAGLRPIIAVVHYPVIGGKAGHRVETPLNVMVHNNTPFQVSVNVKGTHFSASIEGEEVDSWSDELLPSGGIGFFAEAGESARLYWAKVIRNDDWLGRVCSMLAGSDNGASTTSEWLGPNFGDPHPGGTPQPSSPGGAGNVTLAAALGMPACRTRRARDSKHGRFELWSS